ncbi:hypothetical protein ABT136_31270, partial [Streptomyces sp. NPDC001856]
MHGPRTPRSALAARILSLVTTVWLLVGVPAGVAAADACAYASTGPDGTVALAVAGSRAWPAP